MKKGFCLAGRGLKMGGAGTARATLLVGAAAAVTLAAVPAPVVAGGEQKGPTCGGAVICAAERWNDTGVDVRIGEPVTFRVTGLWYDWNEEASFEGYTKPLFAPVAWLRRYPRARWFSLIACVERTRRSDPA